MSLQRACVLIVATVFGVQSFATSAQETPSMVVVGRPADRPVISSGTRGAPILAFDPFVLRDAEGYHLFITSLFCRKNGGYFYSWDPANPAECNILDAVGGTAYAYSSDRGLSWTFRPTPVALPTRPGWDSSSLETPSVVRVDNRLYLFYSGEGQQLLQRFQIGMATLDLVGGSIRRTFLETPLAFLTRQQPVVPIDTGRRSTLNNTQEPSVLYEDGRFVLYFVGLELEHPDRPVSAAGQMVRSISLNRRVLDAGGITLARHDRLLENTVNMPEVVRVDDGYYLFASTLGVEELGGGSRIEYWRSSDGLSWGRGDLLNLGAPAFANFGMISPTVVIEGRTLVLFYTALEVADRPCFPVPASGRLGLPIENGSRCLYSSLGRAIGLIRRA